MERNSLLLNITVELSASNVSWGFVQEELTIR